MCLNKPSNFVLLCTVQWLQFSLDKSTRLALTVDDKTFAIPILGCVKTFSVAIYAKNYLENQRDNAHAL